LTINRNISRVISLFIAISLLATIASILSCRPQNYKPVEYSDNNTYKTFVTPEGENFPLSFEYPSYYRLVYEPQKSSSYISLYGIPFEEQYGGRVNNITFTIINSGTGGYSDSETDLKNEVSYLRGKWFRNFLVNEKHKITNVEGLDGWEIIITYREHPVPFIPGYPKPRNPEFIVFRHMLFDYKGISWRILLFTDADSYKKQTKNDFEHVLRTLKVVNYLPSN
jgi:hypothetical protein